jgi:hypothetical protein
MSVLDVHVAHVADDQGLALAGSHTLDPLRLWNTSLLLEILQSPDVVDLDVFAGAA